MCFQQRHVTFNKALPIPLSAVFFIERNREGEGVDIVDVSIIMDHAKFDSASDFDFQILN